MCVCVVASCRRSLRLAAAAFVVATLLTSLGAGNAAPAAAAPVDFIHADGTHLVDGHGDRFSVKGINLGNWLVPEGYMFKFERARAPNEIAAVILALIGPEHGGAVLERIPR